MRFATRFLVATIAAFVSLGTLPATVSAATGDMNEVLRINDTPTVVRIFEDYIVDRLEYKDGLPFENIHGAADPAPVRAADKIPVILNVMNGLRTQSQLAPLASIGMQLMAVSNGDTDGDLSTIDLDESDIRFIGRLVGEFVKDYSVTVTDADTAALHRTVLNENRAFDVLSALQLSASFDAGFAEA